jgi:hypothetical protein
VGGWGGGGEGGGHTNVGEEQRKTAVTSRMPFETIPAHKLSFLAISLIFCGNPANLTHTYCSHSIE